MQLGNIYPTKKRANPNQGRVYHPDGLSPSLNCMTGGGRQPYIIERDGDCVRVRRYTPKECFRLMGFDDEDVDALIEAGISNTQLYKLAGNSIVVDVVECLFCQIFDSNNEIWV
jgi:DNA (cytosine-5)-methyltransferase 1